MSLGTVARDDFRNAARSYVVVGVVGAFALVVAMLFGAQSDLYDDPYRTLYNVAMVTGLVLPIFLAPLTYLCIAGERANGTIKYVMGLPNSRAEYFSAKLLSRYGVAAAAVVAATLAGLGIAAATFPESPDVWRFVVFASTSLLYALTFVSIFVAVSAVTRRRSRAMVGVFGAYFLLVPFWMGMTPLVSVERLIVGATDVVGITLEETTKDFVLSLSPLPAYLGTTELVFSGVFDQYDALQNGFHDGDELYYQPWYNALVLLGWTAVSLGIGYLKLRTSELV